MSKKPVVLVCCNRTDNWNGTAAHIVRDTYVRALIELSGCVPLLLPSVGTAIEASDIIGGIDGMLLTGSNAHVPPSSYGAEREFEDEYVDPVRDAMMIPLLRAALDADLPVFAICRGFQELNVSCGGTLHQYVHKQPGKNDHRAREGLTLLENLHNRAHKVKTQKGGLFEKWGLPAEYHVNSIHTQGVDRVGNGLHVESISEDGLVEALSMPGKKFVMGVQWHPEGDCFINPQNAKLFERFGATLRSLSAVAGSDGKVAAL